MRPTTNPSSIPYLLFTLSIVVLCGCSSRSLKERYSLITWEYNRAGGGTVPAQNEFVLVKYTYSDSGYNRHEIFKTGYFLPHYSSYKTEVYDNRYLINVRGDIFDLKNNKMIHEHIGFDYFIEKRGDSVFFKHTSYTPNPPFHNDTARFNSIKNPFYFFDLHSGRIVQLDNSKRYNIKQPEINVLTDMLPVPHGILSPNKDMLAYFVPTDTILNRDFSKRDTSLYICSWTRMFPTYGDIYIKFPNNDSTRILHSVLFNFGLWTPNYLPIKWLNNNELLTQKKNGHLVKVDIRTKNTTDYTPINETYPCSFPQRIEETNTNEILYYCAAKGGSIFKVNINSNSLEPVSNIALSKNYSIQSLNGNCWSEYPDGYFYKKTKIIDDTTATIHHSVTPDELIAIQCKEVIPSRNQYDHWNTIKIFDPVKKELTDIKVEYLQSLVGWVKE